MTLMPRLFRSRLLPLLASPLLLWLALRDVSLSHIWAVLAGLGWGQAALLALANGLILLTLGSRWWILLRAQGHPVPYLALSRYRLTAFGITYFTPGPQFGGEPYQVYAVNRYHGVPGNTAIAAVALDKTLELLANFSFLLGSVAFVLYHGVLPAAMGAQALLLATSLLALPLALLAAIWSGRRPATGLLDRLLARLPTLAQHDWMQTVQASVADSERQAASFCRQQPGALLLALAAALAGWAAMVGEFWLAVHLLGLPLSLPQTLALMVAARLAFLLPVPGGLGTLEAGQVLALNLMGLDPAAGLALSLIIRLRDVILAGSGLWLGVHRLRQDGVSPAGLRMAGWRQSWHTLRGARPDA